MLRLVIDRCNRTLQGCGPERNGEKPGRAREIKGRQASHPVWYHYCMVQTRRRWFGVPLLLCVLAVAGLVFYAHRHRVHAVRTGEPLPALSLMTLDGHSAELGSRTSGIVVYNVFATWCPPCRAETPALARTAVELQKRGIKVIGIDQGESALAVSEFAREFNLSYPLVVDPNRQTNVLLGARVIPETIVVQDGIVRSISVGPLDEDAFRRLLAQSGATRCVTRSSWDSTITAIS